MVQDYERSRNLYTKDMSIETVIFCVLLACGIPIYTSYYRRRVPFTTESLGDDFRLATFSVLMISGLAGTLVMSVLDALKFGDVVSEQASMLTFTVSLVFFFLLAKWHSGRN